MCILSKAHMLLSCAACVTAYGLIPARVVDKLRAVSVLVLVDPWLWSQCMPLPVHRSDCTVRLSIQFFVLHFLCALVPMVNFTFPPFPLCLAHFCCRSRVSRPVFFSTVGRSLRAEGTCAAADPEGCTRGTASPTFGFNLAATPGGCTGVWYCVAATPGGCTCTTAFLFCGRRRGSDHSGCCTPYMRYRSLEVVVCVTATPSGCTHATAGHVSGSRNEGRYT